MKITTAWAMDGFSGPYLISAYDELTLDEWGGKVPDFYTKEVRTARQDSTVEIRVIVLDLPDDEITQAFRIPQVKASVSE